MLHGCYKHHNEDGCVGGKPTNGWHGMPVDSQCRLSDNTWRAPHKVQSQQTTLQSHMGGALDHGKTLACSCHLPGNIQFLWLD